MSAKKAVREARGVDARALEPETPSPDLVRRDLCGNCAAPATAIALEYGEYLIGVLVTCDSHDYHIVVQLITIITS